MGVLREKDKIVGVNDYSRINPSTLDYNYLLDSTLNKQKVLDFSVKDYSNDEMNKFQAPDITNLEFLYYFVGIMNYKGYYSFELDKLIRLLFNLKETEMYYELLKDIDFINQNGEIRSVDIENAITGLRIIKVLYEEVNLTNTKAYGINQELDYSKIIASCSRYSEEMDLLVTKFNSPKEIIKH